MDMRIKIKECKNILAQKLIAKLKICNIAKKKNKKGTCVPK